MVADDRVSQIPSAAPCAVPVDYAGQWIAWDHQGTRIVACGRSFPEAAEAAAAAGETQPVFAKVPKAGVRFAGLQR